MSAATSIIPNERIKESITFIRGVNVMFDVDLARLYAVQVKALNQAVKRNIERFPADFMFQLTVDELENLRSQSVTSRSWGGRRYAPLAFTRRA